MGESYFNLLVEAMFSATLSLIKLDCDKSNISIFLLKLCSLLRGYHNGISVSNNDFNLLVEAMFSATSNRLS